MVRQKLLLIAGSGALVGAILGALAAFSPVAAQFGTIFGGPPRPPAEFRARPSSDDRFYSARPQQPIWPREPQVVQPPPGGYPPPPPGYPQQGYPPQQAGRAARRAATGFAAASGRRPAWAPAALPGLPPGQRQPRGTPGDTPATPAPPNDEVVIEPPAQKIPNNQAVFSGLDKITGRIISFDVAINETVQFGALQVTPRVCYTRPPTETANTDSFLEVDEITLQGEIKRLFTGWMFAASPGLNAIEHPIYDVWLSDCKGPQAPAVAEVDPRPAPLAASPAAAAAGETAGAAEGRAAGPAAAAATTAAAAAVDHSLKFVLQAAARPRRTSAPPNALASSASSCSAAVSMR